MGNRFNRRSELLDIHKIFAWLSVAAVIVIKKIFPAAAVIECHEIIMSGRCTLSRKHYKLRHILRTAHIQFTEITDFRRHKTWRKIPALHVVFPDHEQLGTGPVSHVGTVLTGTVEQNHHIHIIMNTALHFKKFFKKSVFKIVVTVHVDHNGPFLLRLGGTRQKAVISLNCGYRH